MTDVNPYASPVDSDAAATERNRVRGTGALVMMHFILSAWLIFRRNWIALTWLHHLAGVVLWFALPLVAFYLVWKGRSLGRWVGRWILVCSFAPRAAGCLLFLAVEFLSHGIPSVPMLIAPPVRDYVIQAMAYGAAIAWLIFSRTMRNRPTLPGENNA